MTLNSTPALMPEWAVQTAVLVAWPSPEGDFSPWLSAVESSYVAIAREVAQRETLLILVKNELLGEHVVSRLRLHGVNLDAVRILEIPYDDIWVRDTAPLSVSGVDGGVYLDFRFNGWGGKYPHGQDAALARKVIDSGALSKASRRTLDFVLEGGSIETDGCGTLMTTSRCLLNPNRNPGYTKDMIEGVLCDAFGVQRVLWIDSGYAEGDDTDAHVDTLARFCPEAVIAYTASADSSDPLHDELCQMESQLKTFRTLTGVPYELVPLPMPAPVCDEEGQRLPATYANFLIINGAVLVPVYGDPMDEVALSRLARVFPSHEMRPIDCLPLIRQYGSLHCMTMQFPVLP